jgi:hypothetical protein
LTPTGCTLETASRCGRHHSAAAATYPHAAEQPGWLALTAEQEADDGASETSSLGCASEQDSGKELDVAGKKRPKSLVQTQKKAPAKPKRPKKTSRGK